MDRPALRQLECVVALAEHLSFRKAAEACFISQPALSLQLQQLERVLGTQLFERDRRRVLLTPAGSELLPHARAALHAIDGFVHAAATLRDPLAGTLRLGVIPTVAPYVLPGVIGVLRKRFPKLRLLLREDQTAHLVAQVQEGKLDLALLALEAELGTLATFPLYSDPFVLAAPAGHAIAARKQARDEDLASEEVLLLEDGHCLREQALSICSRAGARELGDFRATSLNTLVRMVASGTGVTLLPAMAIASEVHAQDRLVTLPLARRASRTIGLVWRASTTRRATFELLAEVLVEFAPKGTLSIARARR
ncbi:MAG: LysR family transcriptional regulator [Planctomycetes bacterium]|nr:LysR family transcriptional regulator [Planctomycetota bacterium]